jgi:murein DD-endopeptidase MepM/ murein hydrolase activator NlpD
LVLSSGGILVKKSISIVLAFTLSIAGIYSVKADELTEVQKKLYNVEKSINDKKEELEDINQEKKSIEKTLGDLNQKTRGASDTLTDLNSKISDLDTQVKKNQKEITQSQISLQHQIKLLNKRARALYINGNEGYLTILLSSQNLYDFLERIDTIVKIMEYDKNLIATIETQNKSLELQKNEIEKKKKETIVLKQQANSQLILIQDTTDEKKNLMAGIVKDKSAYERAIEEEEDKSKAIASMIYQIQKRKEEKSKKQNSSGSNTVVTGNSSDIGKLYSVTGKPTYITSPYGWRVHPVLGTKKLHAGMDLGVGIGTQIYALADGEVIYSGWISGYGNVIMIDHGSLTSLYAHNSSLVGKPGQKVKGGQLISYSGDTGLASGPNMHLEVRKENGEAIDPNPYYVK